MTEPRDDARLAGLLADLRAIYPGAAITIAGESAGLATEERSFRVLPRARHPRIAVPADVPGAARAALRRTTAADSRAAVTRRTVIGTAASSPLRRVFRTTVTVDRVTAGAVEHVLSERTGDELRLSLQIGKPRANAKPVLGVYTTAGAELGFCKVGITGALSAALVEHETAALRRVRAARPATFRVPGVVHAGDWSGGPLLLMTPEHGHRVPRLVSRHPADRGRTTAVPVHVIREIAELGGIDDRRLDDTHWATEIAAHARESAAAAAELADIPPLTARLLDKHGGVRLPVGAWHGDFGPWNMAWHGPPTQVGTPPRALVWDWERLADGVPAGLDAAHYAAHDALRAVGEIDTATTALGARAEPAVADVLTVWVPPHRAAAIAPVVVDCYLLSIAVRFGADAARAGTPRVAELARWYATLVRARLEAAT